MGRKNRSPEENERRAKIRELLQASNISSMDDIQNLFKETIAEFMENGLDAELDDELGYRKYDYKNKDTDNSRNGHSSKTLRTSFGDVEVSVPRDRKGEYEPQLLKKNQTCISQDIEEKILSMYAKGMTTSDIETHIRDIYGIEVSDTTVSRVTDKILPVAKEWQQRPLETVYAVVFLDAIHFHVRSEGQIVKKAVYIAIGINLDGRKNVLGMWVGENESAKFWATVLNGLRNRGVEDIFIACTDNLTGFSAAIEAVFPKTEIQNCIIHQIRNSTRYVSYKDLKALMADLKAVYAAVDEATRIEADNYKEIVYPLPVEDLLYVGPATSRKLRSVGISTIGRLAECPVDILTRKLGKMGAVLSMFANGRDNSPVQKSDHIPNVKSVGNSATTPRDLVNDEDVHLMLFLLAESVASRMRELVSRCTVVGRCSCGWYLRSPRHPDQLHHRCGTSPKFSAKSDPSVRPAA